MPLFLTDYPDTPAGFVLACLRHDEDSAAKLAGKACANIDTFRSFLSFNRVLPLVYDFLKTRNLLFLLPSSEQSFLKETYKKIIFRHMETEGAFRMAATILAEAGIEYTALKGIALSELVYPQPAFRPMSDIDLLVHGDQLAFIRQNMLDRGAKEAYPIETHNSELFFQHIPPLILKKVAFEFHYHLFPESYRMNFPASELWEHSIPVSLYSQVCRILDYEYFLYHLCAHLQKELAFESIRLIWILDIHLFITKYSSKLDWNKFEILVLQKEGNTRLYECLVVSQALFCTPLPEKLNSGVTANIELLVQKYLRLCRKSDQASLSVQAFSVIPQIKGFRNKIQFIGDKLFPSRAYLIHTFHCSKPSLWFLYYPVLYWKYTTKLALAIFRKKKSHFS